MRACNRVLVDGVIFGGMAGITGLIILSSIGYYFDLGSTQAAVDHFMP